jgi:predicted metal-dependent hydrolase
MIEFNKLMTIPENITVIHNDTVQINETTYPVLNVSIVAGAYSDQTKLYFNWTTVSFEKNLLII